MLQRKLGVVPTLGSLNRFTQWLPHPATGTSMSTDPPGPFLVSGGAVAWPPVESHPAQVELPVGDYSWRVASIWTGPPNCVAKACTHLLPDRGTIHAKILPPRVAP